MDKTEGPILWLINSIIKDGLQVKLTIATLKSSLVCAETGLQKGYDKITTRYDSTVILKLRFKFRNEI